MSAPPFTPVEELNRARRSASLFRAEWLMLIHGELVTPGDLLQESSRTESASLLKLSLRQVLLAQPGWGRVRTDAMTSHIMSVTGVSVEQRKLTIGWVLDPRSGGRRFAAWLDAIATKDAPPWAGFPYAGGGHV